MTHRTRTNTSWHHSATLASGITVGLGLTFEPCSMDYRDYLIYEKDGKLLLGYLTHDSDVSNPLEDQDGNGRIFTARRHSPDLSDYLEALGLHSSGRPNLDLIDEEDIKKEIERQLRLMADCKHPQKHSAQLLRIHGDLEGLGIPQPDEGSGVFQHVMENIEEVDLEDYFDFDQIRQQLWEAGRTDGTVGNKYVVMLDVYEHSMVKYSLTGKGPQCQWDTARGGAVWIPDDMALEEIKRRGPVYQKGKVIKSMLRSKEQYNVRTWAEFGLFDEVVHPTFEEWSAAFQYLEKLEVTGFVQPLYDGEFDAAQELARSAAEEYTDYCNGNCFSLVTETYTIPPDVEEDQEIDSDDHDAFNGFIGDDYAYNSLKQEFDGQKDSL